MMHNIEEVLKYTQNLNLLYVEDNKEARESTLLILEEFFQDITIAVDGQDGLDKFKSNNIDIIITDINMPNLTGLQMIEYIKEINSDIPILVLSAHNESSFFIESIKLGVEGYLLKPIDFEQFLNILYKIVSKIKLKDEAKTNLFFLKQYEKATNHSSIVSKTDPKGIITFVNDEFCRLSGYSKDELIGKNHNIVRHPNNLTAIYEEMWDTISNKKEIWSGLLRNRSKDGDSYYVKTTITPILDTNNNIIEFIALRSDVTDIMNPVRQLEWLIETTNNIFAIMIKIDGFEKLLKVYGEVISHKIEIEVEKLLTTSKCRFEKVFPLGHGKFVFAKSKYEDILDESELIESIKKFQHTLNNSKVTIDNFEYDLHVLISCVYDDENILENLHYGLDILESTQNDFIVANGLAKEIKEKAKKNMETISMVKTALDNHKILSYFQPIINNKTQEIEKYESLVRLVDENGKVLSPFFFLDVSKTGQYYNQITHAVLKNSFKALKNTTKDISMNLSAIDIENEHTKKFIFSLLESHKEYNSRIVFELLEDENVKNFDTIKKFINDVKKYGVQIAIDDFGAGYSNFERLLDYQPDILKIDGCLIKDILDDNYSLSIVETIISFAKKQNIKTVAEFVENEDIFKLLKKLGIDYSQGYYFGKPEPMEE